MKQYIVFFILVFALIFQSCKSSKKLQTVESAPHPGEAITQIQPADELILRSIQQRSDFDWFAANLSGSINFAGDYNTFNGQIRIKNGEEIWITITKLGLEIARLKITTDSVFLHNRLERTATIRDFSYFKELTGVDFTFDMLQDMLLGNYFLGEPNGAYFYDVSNDHYAFASNLPTRGMSYDFVLHNTHHKFLALTMRDASNRSVRVDYENYMLVNDGLYPQKMSMQMRNPVSMDLILNYQRIQIDVPQSMPFSIPESVKRM